MTACALTKAAARAVSVPSSPTARAGTAPDVPDRTATPTRMAQTPRADRPGASACRTSRPPRRRPEP
ncbi:hypothetical protein ABZ504_55625, partial [Streptomyces mirabilis]